MTRWGLVSDVHGNLPALEEALRILGQAGAGRLAFLGDYLGRGDSDGCARRIREVADLAVVGNRDLDWQMRVNASTRAWVLGLPRMAVDGELVVAHGDARLTRWLSTNQVRRGFVEAYGELERLGGQVLAFGHSHHARVWQKRSQASPAELVAAHARMDLDLSPGSRYFVSVGTTGLPFPGKGGPSVACLDLELGWVEILPVIPPV
jgi:predicted phosphodiesterase